MENWATGKFGNGSRSRSSVDWRSSVDAEAECVTSDWTAVNMSSFLTALSLQHEKEADHKPQTSRIRICVDRRMDSNTPVERLQQRGRCPFMSWKQHLNSE